MASQRHLELDRDGAELLNRAFADLLRSSRFGEHGEPYEAGGLNPTRPAERTEKSRHWVAFWTARERRVAQFRPLVRSSPVSASLRRRSLGRSCPASLEGGQPVVGPRGLEPRTCGLRVCSRPSWGVHTHCDLRVCAARKPHKSARCENEMAQNLPISGIVLKAPRVLRRVLPLSRSRVGEPFRRPDARTSSS
jgi:hypothetical protein